LKIPSPANKSKRIPGYHLWEQTISEIQVSRMTREARREQQRKERRTGEQEPVVRVSSF
jgi:hypothetical protein